MVTPYHSFNGAPDFQFVLSDQFGPSVASYSASRAARSVAALPCATASAARPTHTASTANSRDHTWQWLHRISSDSSLRNGYAVSRIQVIVPLI